MEVGFGAPQACYVCGAPVIVWVRHWRHGSEERRVLDQDGAQGHHACPPAAWAAYYTRREALLPADPWAFPDHVSEGPARASAPSVSHVSKPASRQTHPKPVWERE